MRAYSRGFSSASSASFACLAGNLISTDFTDEIICVISSPVHEKSKIHLHQEKRRKRY